MTTFSAIPKDLFFDRKKVLRAVARAERKSMGGAGALIRTTARRSMRPQGKKASTRHSKPGNPPRAAKGADGKLKRLLFFAYEPTRRTVVVGPVGRSGSSVPSLHEFGGTKRLSFRGVRARGGKRKTVVAKYPPRPYMSPALQSNLPEIPKQWRNAVKGP